MITRVRAVAETDALWARVNRARQEREWASGLDALAGLLEHPCTPHLFSMMELWCDVALMRDRTGDYDAAIAATEQAIATGERMDSDLRADIAEFHLHAGRRAEADELLATARREQPDDTWLYVHAGEVYAMEGDHPTALAWFTDGIQHAMELGDPEQVVMAMNLQRTASLKELGREPDELSNRAERYAKRWRRPAGGTTAYDDDDDDWLKVDHCDHCGWDAADDAAAAELDDDLYDDEFDDGWLDEETNLDVLDRIAGWEPVAVSMVWFPGEQWARALARWPELSEAMESTDSAAYNRHVQGRLLQLRQAGAVRVSVAPVDVDEYEAWTAATDHDPEDGQSRATYAAHLDRLDRTLPWPPGRNEPCWCGSAQKYKKCCGTVPEPRDEG